MWYGRSWRPNRRWDRGFGLDEVGPSSALLVSCSSGFSFYIISRNRSTPSVTGAYPFLYCAAISVFLTSVPSHRCMPVRMIFGSTNACSFELLKRCNFFVYDSPCFLTGWAIQDMLWAVGLLSHYDCLRHRLAQFDGASFLWTGVITKMTFGENSRLNGRSGSWPSRK